MEPITLILTALAAGAASGATAVASEAIKDGYDGLRTLVQRKITGNADAEHALTKYEAKPDVWEAPLKDELIQAQADQDEEIIRAAQQVLTLVNPQQAALGKYSVQITGNVQGFVQGDHAHVTQTFTNRPTD